MADLEPLIRYRKYIVDEKQRFISQLYREAERLQQQKQIIVEQMAREEKLAVELGTAEAVAYLGRYLEGARRKVRALEQSLGKMETRIAVAQEDMRTAFAEMKKVEIVQRNREQEEKAESDKKESNELDDIGVDRFLRDRDD